MKNIPLLIGTVVGTLILIVAVSVLFGQTGGGPTTGSEESVDRAVLEADLTLTKGQETNPAVVVVEFSDFQCPACRATAPLVTQLSEQYKDNVLFAFKHFPLQTFHPNAYSAALAAQSASLQGKFWEMHDLLFDRQDAWSDVKDANELTTIFVGYATELGLNADDFKNNLDAETVTSAVQADINLGTQFNVNSTPTFFVNGRMVNSSGLAAMIEEELVAAQTDVVLDAETLNVEPSVVSTPSGVQE